MSRTMPSRHLHPLHRRPLAACVALALATGGLSMPADGSAPKARAVLPVTSCADDGGPGTLREVLMGAGEGDIVDLSELTCDTIVLTQGRIDISVVGELPQPLLDVTLRGPGRDLLTITAEGASPIMLHGGNTTNGTLTLIDLTIAGGSTTGGLAACLHSYAGVRLERTTVHDCHSHSNLPVNFGGAVGANKLVMIESAITGSSSRSNTRSAIGGGAYVGYTAELVDSVISGNEVSVATPSGNSFRTGGGGLYVRGPSTITRSTISGNTIEAGDYGRGGGLFLRGTAELVDSVVESNSASGDGGGINKFNYTNYGDNITSLRLANTTISGNSAARGGGVTSTRPSTVLNSTIAFNVAEDVVGGFFRNSGGAASVTVTLDSSLLANNVAADTSTWGADFGYEATVELLGGHNLVMDADPAQVPPDTLDADPLLEPLADNGGATWTHALGQGSPAIDAGSNVATLEFDQRGEGFPRELGAAADIGAFESGAGDDDTIFTDGFEHDGGH